VVEAIENPTLPFAVGVQWHPEELYRAHDSAANLFRAFVAAAARHREEREQG
jgi:putative glutamine amidotransferase